MVQHDEFAGTGPLVAATTCATRIDAELLRSALLSAGERNVVVAVDDAGGLHPELVNTYHHAVRLLVPESRLDLVRALIQEFRDGDHALTADEPRDRVAATSSVPLWVMGGLLILACLGALAQAMGLFG